MSERLELLPEAYWWIMIICLLVPVVWRDLEPIENVWRAVMGGVGVLLLFLACYLAIGYHTLLEVGPEGMTYIDTYELEVLAHQGWKGNTFMQGVGYCLLWFLGLPLAILFVVWVGSGHEDMRVITIIEALLITIIEGPMVA